MGKRAVFVDGEFIILYQKDTIILSKLPKLMGTTLDSICRLEDMEAVATRILEIHQELSQLRSYLADCEKPSTQLWKPNKLHFIVIFTYLKPAHLCILH